MSDTPRRVAIYARYSTEHQNPLSVRDQIEMCRDRAAREGWTVVEEYSDAALTGTSNARPGYARLQADLRSGRFDIVLADSLDRISRDPEHLTRFAKLCRFDDIELHSVKNGQATMMEVGLSGTLSEMQIEGVRHATHRGLEKRVTNLGKSAGVT